MVPDLRRGAIQGSIDAVPGGRDALLVLGFIKDKHQGIRLTEERTALCEHTVGPQDILMAFDSRRQCLQDGHGVSLVGSGCSPA